MSFEIRLAIPVIVVAVLGSGAVFVIYGGIDPRAVLIAIMVFMGRCISNIVPISSVIR